jgi:hypothetical protein
MYFTEFSKQSFTFMTMFFFIKEGAPGTETGVTVQKKPAQRQAFQY